MSSSTDESSGRKKISKVSISPISPEALVVRIRKFSTEVKEEDLPQVSSDFKSIIPRPANAQSEEHSRFTMADSLKKLPSLSKAVKKQKQKSSRSAPENKPDSPPCLKHAAENISRKASDIPAEKISLCNSCSKSMLSYIFLVQDFLDSLAKEISGDATPHCLQCARQEVRNSAGSMGDNLSHKGARSTNSERHPEYDRTDDSSNRTSSKRTQKTRSHRHESKEIDEHKKGNSSQRYANQSDQKVQFVYKVHPPTNDAAVNTDNPPSSSEGEIYVNPSHSCQSDPCRHFDSPNQQQFDTSGQQTASHSQSSSQHQAATYSQSSDQTQTETYDQKTNQHHVAAGHHAIKGREEGSTHTNGWESYVNSGNRNVSSHKNEEHAARNVFRAPMERVQPNYSAVPRTNPDNQNDHNNNFPAPHSESLYNDNLDGIISTLSNVEHEIYGTARNGAGWESQIEIQERFGSSNHKIASEAFVTSCRNNAEAIGCLVVGTSLMLCKTSRTLCVLVSDGVSTAFRGSLSNVFQIVQNVRSLDSLGTTKLALVEHPELGISFDKLNVWRLTQFSKCVYLNPDTLVIQNCDELFCHEELSAVPDIGWPDCFNSGVFVFAPSVDTFWKLMEHADKQGSYDGGDQGLLNSFFNSWSSDMSTKLSFIYNLMANVSYTYTPAFKQFGRNVKIVQFHGSFKPWHVKFFTASGQVSPSSPVHPTYVQFVHIWLNIFRISVLRVMSEEIQSYASSQETICAVEILRFFPLPSESEAEFFLTPPSVRLRLAEKKLSRPSSFAILEAQRRKSAEFPRYISPEDPRYISPEDSMFEENGASVKEEEKHQDAETGVTSKPVASESEEDKLEDKPEDIISEADGVFKDKEGSNKKKIRDKNALPGAEVGDYQGMQAWEQGRIDYEGTDSSDNVLKRLQFLMSRPK